MADEYDFPIMQSFHALHAKSEFEYAYELITNVSPCTRAV